MSEPMSEERLGEIVDSCFYIPRDGTTTRILRPTKALQLEACKEIHRLRQENQIAIEKIDYEEFNVKYVANLGKLVEAVKHHTKIHRSSSCKLCIALYELEKDSP